MPRTLTASDRSALIRLASAMPVGSPERKAILKGLVKTKISSRIVAIDAIYEGNASQGEYGKHFSRLYHVDADELEEDDGYIHIGDPGWRSVYSGLGGKDGTYKNSRPYVLLSKQEARALERKGFKGKRWSKYRGTKTAGEHRAAANETLVFHAETPGMDRQGIGGYAVEAYREVDGGFYWVAYENEGQGSPDTLDADGETSSKADLVKMLNNYFGRIRRNFTFKVIINDLGVRV